MKVYTQYAFIVVLCVFGVSAIVKRLIGDQDSWSAYALYAILVFAAAFILARWLKLAQDKNHAR